MQGIYISASITMAASVANCAYYLWTVKTGGVKPHMFTWIIWALSMAIASAVQMSEGAWLGALTTAVGGASCAIIAAIAVFRGEKRITRTDVLYFLGALAAIPLWAMTDDPLSAALLITLIDFLGFLPTFRKTWAAPQQENAATFFIYALMEGLRLYTIRPFTFTATLYPLVVCIMDSSLSFTIMLRRFFDKQRAGKLIRSSSP